MVVRFADSHTKHSNLKEDGKVQEYPKIGDKEIEPQDRPMYETWSALCLHLRDYARRTGFKSAVLGLSGGIDSAVVAAIAAEVFEPRKVLGVTMPSAYSSEGSIEDSRQLARNLKMTFDHKGISELYETMLGLFLKGAKQKFDHPVTDENIQPRLRATILGVHSNDENRLWLTTGNKSEISVGYCTIYGDTCGGLAVISDVWKLDVYALARFINKYKGNVIPQDIITKPPSAELRPDQEDSDSLPPYEILDPLLKMLVDQEMLPAQVIGSEWASINAKWFAENDTNALQLAREIHRKYVVSEYKRQQMPPGPKVQKRSFGSGRRMPIAKKLTVLE